MESISHHLNNTRRLHWLWYACLFAASAFGFFVTYRVLNDQFDRLSRAHQIVAFGDVPFRDFFDPGYFLTLYASAFVERLVGHSLLGELLMNVLAMAAGATLTATMVSRVAGSRGWGLIAAILIVGIQPRPYDYDKVLFFPLGLYACWRYADEPVRKNLIIAGGVAAFGGLFRYDSGVYLFLALVATIVARHWPHPRDIARRIGGAVVAAAATLAPAAIFIQSTAGLRDALDQMRKYAIREGRNGHIFELPPFSIDWHAPLASANAWLPGLATRQNAGAWLYWVAVGCPVLVLLFHWRLRRQRDRSEAARVIAYATLAELLALFILRNPITARVGALMPIVTIGVAYAVSGCRHALRSSSLAGPRRRLAQAAVVIATASLTILTSVCVLVLGDVPSKANLDLSTRLKEFSASPPSLANWPDPRYWSVSEYIRTCTKPDDRVLAAWFFGELYYFSDRGFAAGLPVLFEGHWSDLSYQRRSLELLKRQSVPIILATQSKDLDTYQFISSYINREYRRVVVQFPPDFPDLRVWVRRDIQPSGYWPGTELPCFAGRDVFAE